MFNETKKKYLCKNNLVKNEPVPADVIGEFLFLVGPDLAQVICKLKTLQQKSSFYSLHHM